MNRRTFVKAAAATPLIATAASGAVDKDLGKPRTWPETVCLDNPIAHPYSVKFVEEVPLEFRAHVWGSSFEKEPELFRFTAHEWICDALLFRGLEIRPKDPSSARNILDAKLNVYVDDHKAKVLERWKISDFMKEGGCAFPLRAPDDTKALHSVFRGWAEDNGYYSFSDQNRFLGYFLPSRTPIIVTVEDCESVSLTVKCDIARYTVPPRI